MTTKKQYTNEELITLLNVELKKTGKYVYSDKIKTIEEMLRIRGVKIN